MVAGFWPRAQSALWAAKVESGPTHSPRDSAEKAAARRVLGFPDNG